MEPEGPQVRTTSKATIPIGESEAQYGSEHPDTLPFTASWSLAFQAWGVTHGGVAAASDPSHWT